MNNVEINDKVEILKKDYNMNYSSFEKQLLEYIKKIKYILIKNKDFDLTSSKFLSYLTKAMNKICHIVIKYYIFIPLYAIDKIIDSIDLHTDFMPKNTKKVKLPPELQTDFLITNETYNIDDQIQKSITKFIELLHRELPKELLAIFYRNITSLDINNNLISNKPTEDTETLGTYNVRKNKISILNNEDETSIFHELFHMASSYFDPKTKTKYCGFSQNRLGRGINEGYTQLLTNRYAEEDPYSYSYETFIAKIIEIVVSKENMQSNYFSANLKGLIYDLSKYKTEQEIMKFIQCLDFYTKYNFNKKLLPTKAQKLNSGKQYIAEFLRDIRLKKLKLDIDNLFLNNSAVSYAFIENEIREIRNELHELELITFDESLSLDFIDKILNCIGYTKEKDANGNILIVNQIESYQMEDKNNGR